MARIVVPGHQSLGVGEDLVVVLHDAVGRQPAVLLGQAHGATGRVEPQAQLQGGGDLGGDQITCALRVDVEVIGRRRAATEGQFGQANPGRDVRGLLVEPAPQGVERREPLEQGRLRGWAVGPREVLVDVVVGVDETGSNKTTGCVQHLAGDGWRLRRRTHGLHQPAGDRDPAARQLSASVVDRGHQLGPAHEEICHGA